MVDALVSGASAARRASSSLVPGTKKKRFRRSSESSLFNNGYLFKRDFYKSLLLKIIKNIRHAVVAQLVEHNLAKVGVASSSLVFRSVKKINGS